MAMTAGNMLIIIALVLAVASLVKPVPPGIAVVFLCVALLLPPS